MEKDTLQIISNIYDSVIDSSLWNDALSSLVTLTNSDSGLLLSCSDNQELCRINENYNIDPYWLKLYDEHYYQYDPSMEVLSQFPNTVISNHVAGFERKNITGKHRVFYNEVLIPQNFYHSAACCIAQPSQNHHALIMTRTKRQGAYSDDRLKQLELVTIHLSKALQISQKMWELGVTNNALLDVMEKESVGVILFNQNVFPVYISEHAEAVINNRKDLHLRNGRISANSMNDDNRLQKLISDSIGTASGTCLNGGGCLRLGNHKEAVQLLVTPMSLDRPSIEYYGESVYAALIIINENNRKQLLPQALIELYGLTMAEADLVVKLAGGLSLNEIAEVNQTSRETVRSQLKSSMSKTSTKRQSDLVRLVTNSIARFM